MKIDKQLKPALISYGEGRQAYGNPSEVVKDATKVQEVIQDQGMTNAKTLKEYVLSCIDLSDYDRTKFPTLRSIIEGLPSAVNLEFSSFSIRQLISNLASRGCVDCMYAELKPVPDWLLDDWYWLQCAKIIHTYAIYKKQLI